MTSAPAAATTVARAATSDPGADGDALTLGEPLAPDPGKQPDSFGLVEQDCACRPAVGESEPV